MTEPAALEGDLRHFYTTEVLQFLRLAGATGRLEFERSSEPAERSNEPAERSNEPAERSREPAERSVEPAVHRVELYLERGTPVLARTSGPSVRTGDVLLHHRAVTREALDRALAAQAARPGARLGAVLVAAGEAPREEVARAVGEVLKRIVFGLLLWSEGRFRFVPGEPSRAGEIVPELDIDRLILEGLRRADESVRS